MDTQATYTISGDATLSVGAMRFRTLSRLGNFDGSGSDDLAVGFPLLNSTTGAVFILRGSSTFASATIPDAAVALQISGTTAGAAFGHVNLGIGPFFPAPGLISTALVASTVYAFAGQATAGPITSAMNDDSVVGTTVAQRYGMTLGSLGAIGTSPAAVSIGSTIGQYVDVHLGTAATGPFMGAAGSMAAPAIHWSETTRRIWLWPASLGRTCRSTSSTALRLRACPLR
jgi:hypothetical protein